MEAPAMKVARDGEAKSPVSLRHAWEPFVAGLRAFVARRVPRQDADDVAQEVLLRLSRGAAALRDASRAESWVYGVARRAIADHYRSRRPAESLEDPDRLPDPGADAGSRSSATGPGAHEEVLSWLRPMAEELPEKYRQALVLADFEGRPQAEVARRLGLSLSGAKSRVQRARALLGDNLRRCCELELGPEGRVVGIERRACDC